VLRVRKAVQRLVRRSELVEPSGGEIEASWDRMLAGVHQRAREAERRLARAVRALNRLTHS
jgi:hypothetical protein